MWNRIFSVEQPLSSSRDPCNRLVNALAFSQKEAEKHHWTTSPETLATPSCTSWPFVCNSAITACGHVVSEDVKTHGLWRVNLRRN